MAASSTRRWSSRPTSLWRHYRARDNTGRENPCKGDPPSHTSLNDWEPPWTDSAVATSFSVLPWGSGLTLSTGTCLQFNWAKGSLTGGSVSCLSNCPSPPLWIPDLSAVPWAYHDLGEVFSKQQPLSLPPDRPCKSGIDLLPGAPLPSSRLHKLSRPKQEAMD